MYFEASLPMSEHLNEVYTLGYTSTPALPLREVIEIQGSLCQVQSQPLLLCDALMGIADKCRAAHADFDRGKGTNELPPKHWTGVTLLDPAEPETSVRLPFSSTWIASLFEDGALVDQHLASSNCLDYVQTPCWLLLVLIHALVEGREAALRLPYSIDDVR